MQDTIDQTTNQGTIPAISHEPNVNGDKLAPDQNEASANEYTQTTGKRIGPELYQYASLEAEVESRTTTPSEIAFKYDYEPVKSRVSELRLLEGDEKREYYSRHFPCVTFSVLPSGNHSGLICASLKLNSERLAQLSRDFQRDPAVYLLMVDLLDRGLHVVFKVDVVRIEDHSSGVSAVIDHLRQQYDLTQEELSTVRDDPQARCILSQTLWTDFYSKELTTQKDTVESVVSEGHNTSTHYEKANQPRDVLNRVRQERVQAEKISNEIPIEEDKPQLIKRPVVGAFPVDIFPRPLQHVIDQTELNMNFRVDWIGPAILYAACVAVGNCIGARYKNYEQKATVYLAIVGMPGANKSGPLEYALKPLRRHNSELYKTFKEKQIEYNQWLTLGKKERETRPTVEPPIYNTVLVSDITPEGLCKTHQENPLGLGLVMDELAGWFQNFNRYNAGSEQEFWLSNWSFSSISLVRKSSPPVLIDQPFISVAGTIQPGVLSELAKDRRNQNGFIDRILFAYPDSQEKAYDSDSELDEATTKDYFKSIDKLLGLRQQVEYDELGNQKTKWLEFAPDALLAMREWRNLNTDLVNATQNPSLKGVYTKLDVYCLRFALIIELLDYACNSAQSIASQIHLTSVERAIKLTDYFRQNAEKVFYELNEQTPADQLPSDRQRLFDALPDEVETRQAVEIGTKIEPPISESTVKRLLKNQKLFKRVGYGEYAKLC